MTPAQRQRVVDIAMAWVGTPYVHMGRIKGVGVDCGQLLILVYAEAGVIEDFDPGTYTHDWYLHRSEELYLGHLLKLGHKTTDPQPGDVAAYRMGRTVSHAGIIVSPGYFVHAYRPHGQVDLMELRSMDSRLDSYWKVA